MTAVDGVDDVKPSLADLFSVEPPDKTRLVLVGGDAVPYVIWRDDEQRREWGAEDDECWFSDSRFDPMTLAGHLADATEVFALVPLEGSDLFWSLNPNRPRPTPKD